eukprot:s58_g6.t1
MRRKKSRRFLNVPNGSSLLTYMWAAPGGASLVRGYDNAQTGIYSLPNRGVAMFKDSPAQAPAFCQQLQRELLQYSYGSVRFENIDVSTVSWDQAQLCQMFDLLRASGASSQRIKAYRVGATDASMRSLCEWLMCTDARRMPQEIHLSHNGLTTESLQVLLTVLEAPRESKSAGLRQPLGLQAGALFALPDTGKSTVVDHLVNLKAMALQLRGRDATADPQSYDKEALQVRQARQVVSTAASKASAEAALEQQQQMLHAQQIQAQQQAQQLQFQQMQAQQWQYQAQAAQAQQMAQQPAPQAAAQASDPVPAKPQETKDTATDLLRAGAAKAVDAARLASEGQTEETKEAPESEADPEVERALNKARAQVAAQEIEQKLAKDAEEREAEEAKAPKQEPSPPPQAPATEPPPLPEDVEPAKGQPGGQSGSTAVSSKRSDRDDTTRTGPYIMSGARRKSPGKSLKALGQTLPAECAGLGAPALTAPEGEGLKLHSSVEVEAASTASIFVDIEKAAHEAPSFKAAYTERTGCFVAFGGASCPSIAPGSKPTTKPKGKAKPKSKPDPAPWTGKAGQTSSPDRAESAGKAKSPSPTAAKTAADGGQSSSVPESPATGQLTEDSAPASRMT